MFQIIILWLLQLSYIQKSPNIKLQINSTINLSKSWYVQQQIIGYQSNDDLYCVTNKYNIDNYSHVTFFDDKLISKQLH